MPLDDWTQLDARAAERVHPAAFEAWRRGPGTETLVLLFEPARDDPTQGAFVWQLDMEHDSRSKVTGERTKVPWRWAEKILKPAVSASRVRARKR